MKRNLLISIVSVLFISIVILTVYSQTNFKPETTWEYLVVSSGFVHHWDDKVQKQELDKLGEQGWELIGTNTEITLDGKSSRTRLYFKRAK